MAMGGREHRMRLPLPADPWVGRIEPPTPPPERGVRHRGAALAYNPGVIPLLPENP